MTNLMSTEDRAQLFPIIGPQIHCERKFTYLKKTYFDIIQLKKQLNVVD